MRYTGSALAELINLTRDAPIEYGLLRATPGWKHVGFVLGGIIIVAGMILIVERKFTTRALLTAIGAVLLLIAIFAPHRRLATAPERRRLMGVIDYIWLGILAVFQGPEAFSILGLPISITLVMVFVGSSLASLWAPPRGWPDLSPWRSRCPF